MQIDAIVFDLGGTLIEYAGPFDSWPALETPGFAAAYAYLASQGVDLPSLELVRDTGFVMLPGRWQMAMAGERNLRLADLLGDVLAACGVTAVSPQTLSAASHQYENAICAQAHVLDAAADTLDTLRSQGYKIGLLSNTMFTGQAHIADLKRFGLVEYFDTMLFSADAAKWKPNATPYLQVANELGIAAEAAVFIGDDPVNDILGGQRAGMRSIHIKSSDRFRPLPDVKADAQITSLTELPELLLNWHNSA